ncbi:hypothetical protein [Bradyrhizobium sp.]|uniref:hypothetical protein n=1 Tax=Bradyrhizobium sp. TaxID=376 RepID=UPI0040384756
MTKAQIFALAMPLLTAAVVWAVAVGTRRPWAENQAESEAMGLANATRIITAEDQINRVVQAIDEASRMAHKAQSDLPRLRVPT